MIFSKKRLIPVFVIAAITCSCEVFLGLLPQSTFDTPYPKVNLNIEKEFGDCLVIKQNSDTLYLKLTGSDTENIITDLVNGDTLFSGRVSYYNGLYYFTQALNDTSFWIYAVKFDRNFVYGLGRASEQISYIDEEILAGHFPELVKYINAEDSQSIKLRPAVKSLDSLFRNILKNIPGDVLIYRRDVDPPVQARPLRSKKFALNK